MSKVAKTIHRVHRQFTICLPKRSLKTILRSAVRRLIVKILPVAIASGAGLANQTTRMSVDSNGSQGSGHSGSSAVSFYATFVAFASYADDLVTLDLNGAPDIFLHNRVTGEVIRISVDSNGKEGNANSWQPSISANGKVIAFESDASNLVTGDNNGERDIFVHDWSTALTTRVSLSSSGVEGNGASSQASVSPDGRYVAFSSAASNLVAGDLNGCEDVFLHDRLVGHTTRVSVNSTGNEANGKSAFPSVAAGGRSIAFESLASNLVPGDTNQAFDVFVHDKKTGHTFRTSVGSSGQQASASSISASISRDGRHVAFASYAGNLVVGDTNQAIDVFVHDRLTGQTTLVSVNSTGKEGNQDSWYPSISQDARFVAFASLASNLVAGDSNQSQDVFVHDQITGKTSRISVDSSGVEGNSDSGIPRISHDGLSVAFESHSDNLVFGDTNGCQDVFLNSQVCSAISAYCTASASSIPGCKAGVFVTGIPSLANPLLFEIRSGEVPGSITGTCLFGNNGQASIPFGTLGGLLCVNPPVFRTIAKAGGGATRHLQRPLGIHPPGLD